MAEKLIVILGPTAVGKSALAVNLAKKFNGEVISADSRQIYRGMDLGTGKITEKEMKGVVHHLLDVASPKKIFDIVQYRKLAQKAIAQIIKKDKMPILCGGTGFYIQAVVDGIVIPEVKPDWRLRSHLEHSSTEELFEKLKKLDETRAKTIDKSNRRRLIRALEIVIKTGKAVPMLKKQPLPYPVLIIGIRKEKKELSSLIRKRLLKRLKIGMIAEVKTLHKKGLSWKRLEEFGLEYRWIARYLTDFRNPQHPDGFRKSANRYRDIRFPGKYPEIGYHNFIKSDFFNRLQKESEHFAKRQMTWFKRDKRIHWIKKQPEAEKLVKKFLEKQ